MKRKQIGLWPIFVMLGLIISGFGLKSAEAVSLPLTEDRSVYSQDQANSVIYLYVTVLKGTDKKTGKPVTFKDVNQYNVTTVAGDPAVTDLVMQEGTAQGPDSAVSWKGTINVRGKSSTEAPQKSYKIKLDKSSGPWHAQTTLNLNKHPFDFTRVRNKLSMDYFAILPHCASFRTQFVNLWVKDLSTDPENSKYIDYGLFTHIENPSETNLQAHGLDPKGQLYKAEYFEFLRYADQLKLKGEPGYDKQKFEAVLEIKGSDDHRKLFAMLEDVNNPNKRIEEVVEKYFDIDNLLTWLAVNILVQNFDTNSQNFLLYSPSTAETWYFLPWDYDGAWGFLNQTGVIEDFTISKWQQGVANYWNMPLFNRIFRNPKYLKLLTEKIESVARIMNKQKTMELLNTYRPAVTPFVKRQPDLAGLPGEINFFDAEYNRLANIVDENRQAFYKNLEDPMPFYLADPELQGNKVKFGWEASFDLQGDALSYSFELSADPGFTRVLTSIKLTGTSCIIGKPKAGTYYYRVIARDSKGYTQVAFDTFIDQKGKRYFGVREYVVK